MQNTDLWWVYLIRCVGGRYYVGMTRDLVQRVKHHRLGQAALFTKQHRFECLVGAVPIGNRRQAGRFERKCKRWSPERKHEFFSCYARPESAPDPFGSGGSKDMTRLWSALAIHAMPTEDAEIDVWEALKALTPELCVAISYLVPDERRAARWICHPIPEYEESPACLVAKGRFDVVMAMLLRSLHGIC